MHSFGVSYNKSDTEFQKIISQNNQNIYSRFIPEKFANSGQDPKGKILEFIKKDFIKPIQNEKPKIYKDEIDKKIQNSTSWAINTTKNCTNEINLPKLQSYNNYNFIKKNEEKTENYKKSYLSTDNISFRIPVLKEKQNDNNLNDINNRTCNSNSAVDLKSINKYKFK